MKMRTIINYIPVISLMAVTVSGCTTSGYVTERKVQVKTLPNASIYLDRYKDYPKDSEIQLIGEADSTGHATINLSPKQKDYYKKRVTVAKQGYEPAKFKTKNSYVFAPGNSKGSYMAPRENVMNDWTALSPSQFSAAELFQRSQTTLDKKKRWSLLRQTIYQDPNNVEGYKNRALNAMAAMTNSRLRGSSDFGSRLEFKFDGAYLFGTGDAEGTEMIYPSIGFGVREKHGYYGISAGAALDAKGDGDALIPIGTELNLYIGNY